VNMGAVGAAGGDVFGIEAEEWGVEKGEIGSGVGADAVVCAGCGLPVTHASATDTEGSASGKPAATRTSAGAASTGAGGTAIGGADAVVCASATVCFSTTGRAAAVASWPRSCRNSCSSH
jgi:hypothetical protein